MTATITIPSTEAALKSGLNGLDALLTAKEWERAAIVYAWTMNEGKGRPVNAKNLTFTVSAFAGLNIAGLTSRPTVAAFRKAWESGGGSLDVKPGDTVTLPTAKWKDHYASPRPGVGPNSAADVPAYLARKPEVVAEAIKAVPAIAAAAVEAIAKDDVLADEVHAKAWQRKTGATRRPRPTVVAAPTGIDYDAEVQEAVRAIARAMYAHEKGEWTPTARTQRLWDFLPILFSPSESEKQEREAALAVADIEEFLAQQKGVAS